MSTDHVERALLADDTVTIQVARWNPHNPNGQLHVHAKSSEGRERKIFYLSDDNQIGPFIGSLKDHDNGFFNPPEGRPTRIAVATVTASAAADVVGPD